jgi:hypothetical protein
VYDNGPYIRFIDHLCASLNAVLVSRAAFTVQCLLADELDVEKASALF